MDSEQRAEPISTIAVMGLPDEMHPRELRNLVAFLPGFVACDLNPANRPSKRAIGFVRFGNQDEAREAMRTLEGYVFDEDLGTKLKLEVARRDFNEGRPGFTRRPSRHPM